MKNIFKKPYVLLISLSLSMLCTPTIRTETLAAGSNKNILIYNIDKKQKTAKVLKRLKGHTSQVRSLAFSPLRQSSGQAAGKYLASSSRDKTIIIWSTKTWKQVATLKGHKDTVFKVIFHPTLPIMASASGDQTIKLWNISDPNPQKWLVYKTLTKRTKKVKKRVKLFDRYFTGTLNGRRYDKVQTSGHTDKVRTIAFHPRFPNILVSGAKDGRAIIWNIDSYSKSSIKLGSNTEDPVVFGAVFHPHKNILYIASSHGCHECTLDSDFIKFTAKPKRLHKQPAFAIILNKKANSLVKASNDTISIISTKKETTLKTLRHKNSVTQITLNQKNDLIASGSKDKTIKIWNTKTWENIITIHRAHNTVSPLAFMPDNKNQQIIDLRKRISFTQKQVKPTLCILMPNSVTLESYISLM